MSRQKTSGAQPACPAVLAENLTHCYKNAVSPALQGCSLRVQHGEFYGLLGPNGAGKTTLMSVLCGLFAPDQGKMEILGMEPQQQEKNVKQCIGLVPQELALYERLTTRENLIFFGRLHGMEKKYLQQRVRACLEMAGLTEYELHVVASFSGGMKRRLNLAAGILHEPKILFLDEPTVGIDAQSRNLIYDQLSRLNREGMTIMYTTHYMEEARKLCSWIGIIDNGRLLDEGTVDQLTTGHDCPDLESLFLHLTGKQLRDS